MILENREMISSYFSEFLEGRQNRMKRLGEKTQLNIRRIFLVSFDVISIIIAAYGSLLLRFNGPIESQYLHRVNILIGSMILIGLAIFITFRLYHSLWQFASIIELKNIIFASIMSAIANILICELTGNPLPRSCYFIYFLLLVLMVGGSRFIYRFIRLYAARHNIRGRKEQRPLEKVMIIGAGVAGEKVYKEILGSKSIYRVSIKKLFVLLMMSQVNGIEQFMGFQYMVVVIRSLKLLINIRQKKLQQRCLQQVKEI